MSMYYTTASRSILAIKDGVYLAAFSDRPGLPFMFAFTVSPNEAMTIEPNTNVASVIIKVLKQQGIL